MFPNTLSFQFPETFLSHLQHCHTHIILFKFTPLHYVQVTKPSQYDVFHYQHYTVHSLVLSKHIQSSLYTFFTLSSLPVTPQASLLITHLYVHVSFTYVCDGKIIPSHCTLFFISMLIVLPFIVY